MKPTCLFRDLPTVLVHGGSDTTLSKNIYTAKVNSTRAIFTKPRLSTGFSHHLALQLLNSIHLCVANLLKLQHSCLQGASNVENTGSRAAGSGVGRSRADGAMLKINEGTTLTTPENRIHGGRFRRRLGFSSSRKISRLLTCVGAKATSPGRVVPSSWLVERRFFAKNPPHVSSPE